MMIQQVADNTHRDAVDRYGHFIPDERPDYLIEQLLTFLANASNLTHK